MSTFDPTWPTGLVNLDVDYQQGNLNSTQLDATMEVNHYKFSNQTSMNGMHRYIQLPTDDNPSNHVISPPYITTSSELLLYNGLDGILYNLYFIPPNKSVPATGIQLTRNEQPVNGATGYSWIAGGVLVQWGSFNPNVSTAVSFPLTFPNAVYNIQLTGSASTNGTFRNGVSTGTLSTAGFTWEGTVSAAWNPIYYFAIGN